MLSNYKYCSFAFSFNFNFKYTQRAFFISLPRSITQYFQKRHSKDIDIILQKVLTVKKKLYKNPVIIYRSISPANALKTIAILLKPDYHCHHPQIYFRLTW